MLKSEKFFGKRDTVIDTKPVVQAIQSAGVSVLNDKFSNEKTESVGFASAMPTSLPGPRVVPASISSASSAFASSTSAVGNDARSKLTVGPNIKLKGVEITDCDTLIVEGRVEATIDSRVIQISERGAFVGIAEFDIAEIRGEFEGDLTVRQKLVVYASGRLTGKIRYGKLVIEEGGQLCGDVQLTPSNVKGLAVAVSNS